MPRGVCIYFLKVVSTSLYLHFIVLGDASAMAGPFQAPASAWLRELQPYTSMPREEFVSSLKRHPIASLKAWCLELFNKVAKQDLIPHPSDTLVERRGSAVRPLNQTLAEDVWDITFSIENKPSCLELFSTTEKEAKLI